MEERRGRGFSQGGQKSRRPRRVKRRGGLCESRGAVARCPPRPPAHTNGRRAGAAACESRMERARPPAIFPESAEPFTKTGRRGAAGDGAGAARGSATAPAHANRDAPRDRAASGRSLPPRPSAAKRLLVPSDAPSLGSGSPVRSPGSNAQAAAVDTIDLRAVQGWSRYYLIVQFTEDIYT